MNNEIEEHTEAPDTTALMLATVKLQEEQRAFAMLLEILETLITDGLTVRATVAIKVYRKHYPAREVQP